MVDILRCPVCGSDKIFQNYVGYMEVGVNETNENDITVQESMSDWESMNQYHCEGCDSLLYFDGENNFVEV